MDKRNRWYHIKLTIFSICTSLALTMNFAPAEDSEMTLRSIYSDMQNGFGGTAFMTTLLGGLLIWLNHHINRNKDEKTYAGIVCFPIAVVWVMGDSFRIDNTLTALYCSYVQILKTVISVTGITYMLVQASYLLKQMLDSSALRGMDFPQRETRLIKIYRKHPFLCPFIILLAGLFPQLLFSYPAGMSWDARYQLSQFFGLDVFTSHHPPVSTWIMGKIVSLGLLFGNGNAAVFLYLVLQYLLFATVTAYLIYTMRIYFRAPRWLQLITLVITLISPYHAAYVGVMLKDIVYAYMIMLMVTEILYMLNPDFDFWGSWRHIIVFWIAASLTILLRNNGKYVVYPTMLALFLYFCHRKMEKADSIKLCVVFVAVILSSTAVLGLISTKYVEEKGSIKEALSLPFQQTARYLKECGADVTEEEREVISQVLDYENLAALYDPEISDPVKATFNPEASGKELGAYFGVWLKQFFRHPGVYVEATVNQNYVMVYPKAESYHYFTDVVYEDYEPSRVLAEYLGLHEVESSAFQAIATLQTLYVAVSLMLPVWGMTSNVGFYNLLLIFLILFAVRHKVGRTLLVILPLFMSNLIVIAGPCVSPRYLFPVMYAMPAVIAFYMYERKEKAGSTT